MSVRDTAPILIIGNLRTRRFSTVGANASSAAKTSRTPCSGKRFVYRRDTVGQLCPRKRRKCCLRESPQGSALRCRFWKKFPAKNFEQVAPKRIQVIVSGLSAQEKCAHAEIPPLTFARSGRRQRRRRRFRALCNGWFARSTAHIFVRD